ncbi:3-oxoacyl-[acyl-carrier-protein] reductase OS=Castellaniella defragrans OX=75697 GN=HNR28_002208 PE=3 SV=1 [Castellaniella defragrans]
MNSTPQDRRVAVVTGARRGIGRATAYHLAQAGYDLLLNDYVEDDAVAETLAGVGQRGARAGFIRGDISRIDTHDRILDAVYERFGRLDALINNAGIQVRKRGDLLEVTPERFDEIIAINLRGTFFLTQQAARRMLSDGRDTQGRSIIVLSSSNAHLVSVEKGEYCMSKSGLSMMTKLFALRLAEAGISVFEIQPGLIRTDMTAAVREQYGRMIDQGISPVRRWGEADEVAQAITTLVLGQIPFATGIALSIDGGLMIPRL